jgi:hypothetical protein
MVVHLANRNACILKKAETFLEGTSHVRIYWPRRREYDRVQHISLNMLW